MGKDPAGVRVMQWNLLATGLHTDGFVKGDMFESVAELTEHLHLTKDYKARLMSAGVDLDLMKPMQHLLNLFLFSDGVPLTELPAALQYGAEGLSDKFRGVPVEDFYAFSDVPARRTVCDQAALYERMWKPLADFFEQGLASALVEESIETIWSKYISPEKALHPYDVVRTVCDFFRERFANQQEAMPNTAESNAEAGTSAHLAEVKVAVLPAPQGEDPRELSGALADGDVPPSSTDPLSLLRKYRRAFEQLQPSADALSSSSEGLRAECEAPRGRNAQLTRLVAAFVPDVLTLQEVAVDQYFCLTRMQNGVYFPLWEQDSRDTDDSRWHEKWSCLVHQYASTGAAQQRDVGWLNANLFGNHPYRVRKVGVSVCGVAVLVNRHRFRLRSGKALGSSDEQRFAYAATIAPCDERVTDGDIHEDAAFTVCAAHLKSGKAVDDRTKQIFDICDSLEAFAMHGDVVLGMDGNYDQELGGCNYDNDTEAESGGWARLRSLGYCNYLDELRQSQRYGSQEELLTERLHAVTVNKMRGMFSVQVAKWGCYSLRNIDYLMLRSRPGEDQGLRMSYVVNARELQVYDKESTLRQISEDTSIETILALDDRVARPFIPSMMPSGSNPSDHRPVVVQLQRQSSSNHSGSSPWWCCTNRAAKGRKS
ncbi:unnamed protein product [Amoebophrya sp. A120]|nr:unnamed protein product [Amoebophrya sp. A120]|eukprot:GSA120T00002591001.1